MTTCLDFPEGRLRDICEGRAYSQEKTDIWRVRNGLEPLGKLPISNGLSYKSPPVSQMQLPVLPPVEGVGTELKKILGWFGQWYTPGCKCNERSGAMNLNGIGWCENNIPTITNWLREEAQHRNVLGFTLDKIPGFDGSAVAAIKLSIIRAKQKESTMHNPLKWAYGVTTCPFRRHDLLPRTLASLAQAGFDKPRLFVDGAKDGFDDLGLEVTYRYPVIRSFMNWYLGLLELYGRQPNCDRYAMFQDDFVTYKGLKKYLELVAYPEKGYLNLYTFPCNQVLSMGREGWYQSDQFGKGAVALVFSHEAVTLLLKQQHMVDKPQCPIRGHRTIDGGVVDAFRKEGWQEYVHNPSLVQHTGVLSSMGSSPQQLAISFRGEGWDVMELLLNKHSA